MDKKILVVVGMPGAGKSVCVDYLEKQGIPSIYLGGEVVEESKRRHGIASEAYEQPIREEFRAQEGMGAIAKRVIPKIDALLKTHDRVVADGMYSWTEYKMFKQHYGDTAIILAVAAPRHLRHERLAHRAVRPYTEAEVTSREYSEIENIEKGGPIANADYTIVNDSTPEALLDRLHDVLSQTGF